MITGLLLLPVFAILVWLYWYLLPQRRWRLPDTIILITVMLTTVVYITVISGLEFPRAGPLWPQVVSAAGAYAILIAGLVVGLSWRRFKR